jgi:hypothetical protein
MGHHDEDINNKLRLLLTDFPREIIFKIVIYLTNYGITITGHPCTDIPQYGFELNYNHCGGRDTYHSLLNLSSTCSTFRVLLGPILFHNLSLVRSNQVDCIFKNPQSLYQFSDGKSYSRQFLKEVLLKNFTICAYADQAKYSFKLLHKLSKYQLNFSCGQFISQLECDNSLLLHDIRYFPRVTLLKILDQPHTNSIDAINFPKSIKHMSINLVTLIRLENLQLREIDRLDILADFEQLAAIHQDSLTKFIGTFPFTTLSQLHLFINQAYVINYQVLLDLLDTIVHACPKLTTIAIRLISTKRIDNQPHHNWKIYSCEKYGYCSGHYTGLKVVDLVANVSIVEVDLQILNELNFPTSVDTTFDAFSNPSTLVLVEPYMSIPKLSQRLKNILYQIVGSCHVEEIQFKFGEVVDQSDIQALTLITNFISYVCNESPGYAGIKRISLEKCWSITDEMAIRDYFGSLLASYDHNKTKVDSAAIWGKVSFSSPRFRTEDCFEILYKLYRDIPNPNQVTIMDYYNILDHQHQHVHEDNVQNQGDITLVSLKPTSSKSDYRFWSVESSKVELEQYSTNQRRLSSIWD